MEAMDLSAFAFREQIWRVERTDWQGVLSNECRIVGERAMLATKLANGMGQALSWMGDPC